MSAVENDDDLVSGDFDADAHKKLNDRLDASSPALLDGDLEDMWEEYKRVFGKTNKYNSHEDKQRFANFKLSAEAVRKCNAEKLSHTCKRCVRVRVCNLYTCACVCSVCVHI